jgi:hypothetical protein
MLVRRNKPSTSRKRAFEPSATSSSESLRKSTATSFSSRIVESGSLGKRIASSSAWCVPPRVSLARRSSGRCRRAWPGT